VKKPSNLLIGDLGTATDVKVETIRYYERIGLFPAPGRQRCASCWGLLNGGRAHVPTSIVWSGGIWRQLNKRSRR
jgi:MerR family regulatory protein